MSSDSCWERAEYVAEMTVLASDFFSKKSAQKQWSPEGALREESSQSLKAGRETPG